MRYEAICDGEGDLIDVNCDLNDKAFVSWKIDTVEVEEFANIRVQP